MKKTTRLTALLLALVLLLGTLSASATEAGIPLEDLDADTYAALLQAASEETSGADVTVCGTEYCNNVLYMLQQCPTAQDKYEYLMTLYTEVPDDEMATQEDLVLEYTLLHYYECHAADKEDLSTYEVCTCAFPMLAPDSVPGDISKHSEECPWHFANLTTPEQYTVSIMLASYDETAYLATLSAEQATALTTYTAQQNGTLSYPCEEKPEYCQYSVYSQMTAAEIYDYFNAIYDDGNGEISDLYAAMMLHYGEYHLDSNLICTCGDHPLPLPEYEIGDISKHEDTCPWHFANLTVPEQYDVICLLSEEEQPAYYAALTPEQETVLRDYIESILGSSDACDGEECGYKAFAAMSGAERAAQLKEWVNTPSDAMGNMYNVFIAHLYDKHKDADEVCLCAEYQSDPDKYDYGTLNHSLTASNFHDQTVVCPWHFNELSAEEQYVVFVQMTVADQYRVIKDLSTDKQAEYTTKLSQEQLAALTDYMSRVGSSDQESTTEVPKSETTGAAAQITVPANTFGEGVDFVMNAEETAMSDAEQAAVEEIGSVQVLAAYDISFDNAETGVKIQPVNGKVALTFTVETSKITGNELRIYHMQLNEDGTYTAELMGAIEVDRTKDVQEITVYADKFSSWVAAANDCDGSSCYTDAETGEVISLESLKKMSALDRYTKLISLYDDGTTMEGFMLHLGIVHEASVGELICTCTGDPLVYAPGATGIHYEECAWHSSVMTSPTGTDLFAAYSTLDIPHRAYFVKGLDETQKANLVAAMNGGADGMAELLEEYGTQIANWMMDKWEEELDAEGNPIIDENDIPVYKNNGIHNWLTVQKDVTVTMDMIKRAYEVEVELDNRGWTFKALEAMRVEMPEAVDGVQANGELISVYTGQAIADCDAETGAVIDRSMNLIIGYVDTENGTIVAPPSGDTAGGDDTTN